MKIAITTTDKNPDATFDPRFGRAAYFCIADPETGDWVVHANSAVNATGGAGVQAAQFIAGHGAQVAISGGFGPNAYTTLSAAGIQMFLVPRGKTLSGRQLLALFQEGKLEKAAAPTHAGRHSGRRGRGQRAR